jgi:hypothetical protein
MNHRINRLLQPLLKHGSDGAMLDRRTDQASDAINLESGAATGADNYASTGQLISAICDINFAAWARGSRE